MRFDPNDPVSDSTPQLIDEVLKTNKTLAPYLEKYKKEGPKISDKGRFVKELSNIAFNNAYKNANNSTSPQLYTQGFYDYRKKVIHVRPDALSATALHESIHRLANTSFYGFLENVVSDGYDELVDVLKEGVTAYFTDAVLSDEGFKNFNDAYRDQKKKAEKLIARLGTKQFEVIASFNFNFDIVRMANTLGITNAEYSKLNKPATEVTKRLKALL
jgi:hypothetical protein